MLSVYYIFVLRDDARVRITPRHIMLTLRMDRELDELTKDTTIPQVGSLFS